MLEARRGISEVRKLKDEGYTINMLVVLICEAVIKYRNGHTLTRIEQFYAGLRYSEFLVVEDTSEAYSLAEIKRQEYLKSLGTTAKEINEKCLPYIGI